MASWTRVQIVASPWTALIAFQGFLIRGEVLGNPAAQLIQTFRHVLGTEKRSVNSIPRPNRAPEEGQSQRAPLSGRGAQTQRLGSGNT